MLLLFDKEFSGYDIEKAPETINTISENLCRHLVLAARPYKKRVINHGDERYVYEIYGKAMANLLKQSKRQLSIVHRKSSY